MLSALIVEDEPLIREYLRSNLNRIHNSWQVKGCAKDGLEAIEILRRHHFDLVITDIKMPRCNGLELASYIQENICDTFVVILTGYDEFKYAREALRKGVTDYLLKPLDENAMNSLLDSLSRRIDQTGERHACCYQENITEEEDESPSLLIERARIFIKENYTRPLSLNDVASALSVSPSYLSTQFKSDRGETYTKYILRLRMELASRLLESYKAGKVSDIAQEVGFSSTKYFDSAFKKYFGMTPNEYRTKTAQQDENPNPEKGQM